MDGHQASGVQQRLDVAFDDLEHRVGHAALEGVELAAHHDLGSGLQGTGQEWLAEKVATQRPAAVFDGGDEIGTPHASPQRGTVAHRADDRQEPAGSQVANAHEAPRVEVGARIVAQQVGECDQPELLEDPGPRRTHARQKLEPGSGLGERPGLGLSGLGQGHGRFTIAAGVASLQGLFESARLRPGRPARRPTCRHGSGCHASGGFPGKPKEEPPWPGDAKSVAKGRCPATT